MKDLPEMLITVEPGLEVHWGSYILFHISDMFQNEKLVTTTKANHFPQDNILFLRTHSLLLAIPISYLMFYFLEVDLVLDKVNYSLFPNVRCRPQTFRTCIILSCCWDQPSITLSLQVHGSSVCLLWCFPFYNTLSSLGTSVTH